MPRQRGLDVPGPAPGTVGELERELEEVRYEAEEAVNEANSAKTEAEGACYAAGKIVC